MDLGPACMDEPSSTVHGCDLGEPWDPPEPQGPLSPQDGDCSSTPLTGHGGGNTGCTWGLNRQGLEHAQLYYIMGPVTVINNLKATGRSPTSQQEQVPVLKRNLQDKKELSE